MRFWSSSDDGQSEFTSVILINELRDLRASTDNKMERISEKMDETNRTLSSVSQEVTQFGGDVNYVKTELTNTKEAVGVLNSRVSELETYRRVAENSWHGLEKISKPIRMVAIVLASVGAIAGVLMFGMQIPLP